MTVFKNLLKHLANKRAYPHARIAFGSRITGKTTIGDNVQIGRGCYVYGTSLGHHVRISDGCNLFESNLSDYTAVYQRTALTNVDLGSFSYVAEQSQLAGVRIGRFCSIGPGFLCGYGEHPTDLISTSPVFYSTRKQCGVTFAAEDGFQETRETSIGHDVWIGARVFVRDGVRIGNGALIAAGGVVVRDIPDYAIAGGVPAKVIRYRFDDNCIRELLGVEWWNWSEEKLRAAQPLFTQGDANAFLSWAKDHCTVSNGSLR